MNSTHNHLPNKLPKRKRNRLSTYDYSENGAYHITICTKDRQCFLSKIKTTYANANITETNVNASTNVGAIINRPQNELYNNAKVNASTHVGILAECLLSPIGKIVDNAINQIHEHYETVKVDNYVIMPNHVHILISINDSGRLIIAPTVSTIIKQFKSFVSKQVGSGIWQKGFDDHIIRDQQDWQNCFQYIDNNPINWLDDDLYIKIS